ncbi:uncharacterized protein LOC132712796 [Ruditapes philippinarum]|uniref:uncharacterized protein LOC132712796 n=1 Tax=Ruditapes philippinarum TaxID=129788 RepID=UPI00295AA02E|nr:uncharacterized protein LOC132712796 [Ruditapes philippinarum]
MENKSEEINTVYSDVSRDSGCYTLSMNKESEQDICDKRHEAYHLNFRNDGFWYGYGAQDCSFYHKSQRRHDICNEYHGTEMNCTHLSYGAKAMSESNLPSLEDKLTFCSKNTLIQGFNFASVLPKHDDKRSDHLNAFRKEQPNSDRYEDEKKGNEDINFGHFSKSVSPTNIDSRIRPKRLKKKRKITPHRETSMTSLLGIQTSSGSFHHSKKKSYYSQYKRKSKTSRTRKFSKHQKSKTIHNELFSTFFDSGLGSSRSTKSNSLIYMMKQESYKSKSKFSFSRKRSLERLRIQQSMKSITKYERYMKNFFRNRGRLLAKSVARHLIGRPSSNGTIVVLDRYFHRVSNGPPLTTQERMQYEWLRLSTFHNYEGNGNAIVLLGMDSIMIILKRPNFLQGVSFVKLLGLILERDVSRSTSSQIPGIRPSSILGGPVGAGLLLAGFFFVGVADFTRCFCCGGGLRNWEPGDDPVLEHTRWFPRCEYINKLKGERYVAAVQRRHEQHMAEQQRQQTELAQRRDESRNDPDPLTIEAAIQLQDMGYSAERTRQAVIAVRQQTGQSIPTTEQVLTWLLDNEERENGSGMTTEFGVRPQPSETSAVATTVVGTSVPSSTISTPSSIVGTSIPTSVVNTGFGIPTTIVGTSVPTSIVGTSIPSSILNAGSSFESSSTFYTGFNAPSTLVESVSIIGTPNVHTISSTSSSTSQVGAGTTTSTVSSTSTSATAKVQPSVSSASAEGVTEGSSSATGSENNSGSHEAKGSNTEKQSAASGDSDESKQTAKDPSSNEPSNKSNKKKNGKKKAKMKPKSDTAGATGGDVDAQSLKAENEKLKEMQTCKICMERPVNTTLLPCGHLVCCETCAGRLQRCPICRKRIKGTVKTFMS